MQVRVHHAIDDISPVEWNALAGDNPFLRHEFLAALEHSGSADAKRGWQPVHLACRDADKRLVGALPLYLKSHSYGEFVFDWAWADAYQRQGLRYYPKLVSAIPFSPAPGPRLLTAADAPRGAITVALTDATRTLADQSHASSIHCLFPRETELPDWTAARFLTRRDTQFHWHDRGYG